MNRKLLLIGGGGHAKSVIDSLLSLNFYDEIGIIDNYLMIGSNICGIEVIGADNDLEKLRQKGYNYAFITLGSVGDTSVRRKLVDLITSKGYIIPNIIDPTAIVSQNSKLGVGNFVGKNSIINAEVCVGNHNIINSGSIIEHDCIVKNFVHISPNSTVCGGVIISNDVHIGANAVIMQGSTIGKQALIGLGSVVVTNISENMVAYGNPCKEVKLK